MTLQTKILSTETSDFLKQVSFLKLFNFMLNTNDNMASTLSILYWHRDGTTPLE